MRELAYYVQGLTAVGWEGGHVHSGVQGQPILHKTKPGVVVHTSNPSNREAEDLLSSRQSDLQRSRTREILSKTKPGYTQ